MGLNSATLAIYSSLSECQSVALKDRHTSGSHLDRETRALSLLGEGSFEPLACRLLSPGSSPLQRREARLGEFQSEVVSVQWSFGGIKRLNSHSANTLRNGPACEAYRPIGAPKSGAQRPNAKVNTAPFSTSFPKIDRPRLLIHNHLGTVS